MAATKRVVPVQVLVRDDGNYCRMMGQTPAYPSSANPIDASLFSKLSLTDIYRQQVSLECLKVWNNSNHLHPSPSSQFQMYGFPPQLYPYLYAPKSSSLNMHTSLDSSSENASMRHKSNSSGSNKDYADDTDEKMMMNDENVSSKDDADEVLDENENVEIDWIGKSLMRIKASGKYDLN
jgi:predicted  nucleic acid-binding Zn-ribbon protein